MDKSKLKVLVPLDSTDKSRDSIKWLKKFFSSEEVEITLINVIERYYTKNMSLAGSMSSLEAGSFENAEYEGNKALDEAEKELDGYMVSKLSNWGHTSEEILKEAKNGNYDMIVMTKSSVKGISRIIGSVTAKVVRNSEVAVVVIPE
jgi:nucleotide-binding universal stress UspA family protein